MKLSILSSAMHFRLLVVFLIIELVCYPLITTLVSAQSGNLFSNPSFVSNNNNWLTKADQPPAGYIEVPSNVLYANPATYDATQPSKSNFLVMQYEAKYDCTGDGLGDIAACGAPSDHGYLGIDYRDITFDSANVVSTPEGTPLVHITKPQAADACPAPYDLITNDQWMTIARNIEDQTANWADGVIGSTVASGGGLKGGNVGITDSVSYDGANPEGGTGRDTKAKHVLSNGAELWDISGNVSEIVNFDANNNGIYDEADDLIAEQDHPERWNGATVVSGFGWTGFTSDDPVSGYYLQNNGSGTWGYDDFRPEIAALDATEGVGRIYANSNSSSTTKNRVVLRGGGYWGYTQHAGVFHTYLVWFASDAGYFVGFRCASDPINIYQSYSTSSGRGWGGGNTFAVGSVIAGKFYQSVNIDSGDQYDLVAYVQDRTTNNVSGAVDSSVAQLLFDDAAIDTTYTDVGDGWWQLSAQVSGSSDSVLAGLYVHKNKTVRADNLWFAKAGTAQLSIPRYTQHTNLV